jgi:arylsulfatase A-like enzyme
MIESISLKRRSLLAGAAAFAGGALLPHTVRAASNRKPNFIVVMTDDLGFGDIGPYGNTIIDTPNLDRMAADGVTLTDYYAPAAVCTPSRAGMLTGRYAMRSGMQQVLFPSSENGLPLSERTIAKVLKPDYATGMFGKWHLGSNGVHWPPTNHGFDRYFGIPYSHDMEPLALYQSRAGSAEVREMPVDFDFNGALARFDKETMEPASLTSQLQQQFYGAAEQFIEDNRERPFYLELWLSSPHLPEIPAAEFKGTTDAGPYGDMIAEIDSIMGRLRAKLAELGLERDTLVIFTSDNGPWYWGSPGHLRDRKGSAAYDGGSKVPFIAVQPGRLPAGQRVDWLASGLDLLPTFAAMAGMPLPNVKIDGVDITSVLTGQGPSKREDLLFFAEQDLVAVRTPRWKYNRQRTYDVFGYDELYDMEKDPTESYNVRDRHPEVVADMVRRFEAAQAEFAPLRRQLTPPAEMQRPS